MTMMTVTVTPIISRSTLRTGPTITPMAANGVGRERRESFHKMYIDRKALAKEYMKKYYTNAMYHLTKSELVQLCT